MKVLSMDASKFDNRIIELLSLVDNYLENTLQENLHFSIESINEGDIRFQPGTLPEEKNHAVDPRYYIDKLFTRIYEDNVSGKLTDERFEQMSKSYDEEQKKLREDAASLESFISTKEQKTEDISDFVNIVRKYEQITELTPEIMNEMIDRIEVHAPDKSSGHREQQVDIYFRFRVAEASVIYTNERKVKNEQAA